MTERRSLWMAWAGLALSVVALLSYPTFFVRFPSTRDVPWANLLLFVVALALVLVGARRAFAPGSTRGRKIGATVAATLSLAVAIMFTLGVFVLGRQLPAAHGAPQVGQKAPEFQLLDTTGKTVTLSELLKAPINGQAPKGALLVFYRGYW